MEKYTINIRPKRQATLPKVLLEAVGVSVGDELEARVKNDTIILIPQKQVALDAFSELQKIVQESGVNETKLQKGVVTRRMADR